MSKKDQNKVTVVAECTVESESGIETIRSFDKAWHRALEVAPAKLTFQRFVRID